MLYEPGQPGKKTPGIIYRENRISGIMRQHGRLAQLVRASRLHREGRGFESLTAHQIPAAAGVFVLWIFSDSAPPGPGSLIDAFRLLYSMDRARRFSPAGGSSGTPSA